MNNASNKLLYEDIVSNVRTTDERGGVYAGIETLTDALYRSSGRTLAEIIDTDMPHSVVKPLKDHLQRLGDTSDDTVKQFLEDLRGTLEQLEVLSLEVAFNPREETVATLISWVREHVGPFVIIELAVDHTILGGVRIAFNGKFLEKNLASLIEQVMRQKHDIIQHTLYE